MGVLDLSGLIVVRVANLECLGVLLETVQAGVAAGRLLGVLEFEDVALGLEHGQVLVLAHHLQKLMELGGGEPVVPPQLPLRLGLLGELRQGRLRLAGPRSLRTCLRTCWSQQVTEVLDVQLRSFRCRRFFKLGFWLQW